MKSLRNSFLLLLMLFGVSVSFISAQEEEKSDSPFSVGADIYSSYVWRGTKFAGPSIQPSLSYTTGGLTVGVWGSYGTVLMSPYVPYYETDPYISYGFDFGLSLGLTAYYYEGDISKMSDTTSSFAYEVNLGYSIKGLSLSANYILNDSHAGALSAGGDKYFQAQYDFKNFSLFAGAGDGWHTSDGDFAFCNIGLSTSKTIDVTDKFSIPVSGSVIVNPDKKQMFLVVGFSF